MNLLREVRDRESSIDMEINPVMDMYRMLEHYLPQGFMDKEEIDKKTVLRANWKKLIKLAETRADELSRTQAGFKKRLCRDVKNLSKDVVVFRQEFVKNGPMVQGIPPWDAVERLTRFKEELKIHDRKYKLYTEGEDLFALTRTKYPELMHTLKEVKLLDQLFGLYTDVLETFDEWKQIPWTEVTLQMEEMTDKMDNFALRCKKMPGKLKKYEAFTNLNQQIEDFQTVLPLLQELSKESIMPRHWDELREVTGSDFEISADFKLIGLLDLDLVRYKDDVEEITEGADKQLKIEIGIAEIRSAWEEREFSFSEWKGRGIPYLKATTAVTEELEEAQMNLQTFLTMRHVAPFREEAQGLLQQLSDSADILERWVKVQMMWCSLESVFTGGDIAKQMPMEAKKFAKVDKDWGKIMNKSFDTKLVIPCCENEALRTSLPVMYQELEKCQKSLEGYLEAKRNKFPRFYFVSNPGLLIILSQGSDPLSMNDHYEKVFDALEFVDHNAKDKTIIEKMHGSGGKGHEVIPFIKPVKAVGNIEDWLCELLKLMQLTLKDLTRTAASQILQIGSDLTQLRPFVDASIAQLALLGIQIMWTNDTQTALEQARVKKNAMKECNSRQLQVLNEISSWCLEDLGAKVNRKKIETLVTIHVHQRDVTNELTGLFRAKKIQDASDFDWMKQARFYFRPNGSDECSPDGATVVGITDNDFTYQYEYMGAKERLVITPLTDKCYITLAQALGMCFGGAPAGPAGTGKTETVKDLGSTLGIFVVVTNCTDQQSHLDCAKIFKGLCQGGLWGCFDEFNRIRLAVLSVVAQQVLAIQNAKKANVQYFQFPGDPQNVLLLPVCAFFITMNPGYAGRQELPENLKALFRGVAMMVPDFQIIMKVKLCSVGYSEFELLSQKFFVLYNTCKQQLSAQKHYDWGLRNILSVLRTAGQTKRDNLDKAEAFLLYRTLRDMNLSKLVAQDVPLFLSVLADLFPSIPPPPKGEYPEVEKVLAEKIDEAGLVQHSDWKNKVIQLYETTRVRHGIMLVGPTGGGKSTIFTRLRLTLEVVNKVQYREARLNPKAIRAQEMYGEMDPLSGEWTTGVFAAMWAKYNNRNNAYNSWIIADGPVDAIWIEDLNTVLDDNRLLTLANGDRIPMTDNVKIMFEVETLINASPATVSRAGIIFVSDTDLDWAPPVKSWVRRQPDALQQQFTDLFERYLGDSTPISPGHLFEFLIRSTAQVLNASRVGSTMGMCALLQGLMMDHNSEASTIEKLFLYSLAWGVGGLLETEDRVKLDAWLRERDQNGSMPTVGPNETIFEYFVDPSSAQWTLWRPPTWTYPTGDKLDFSNLLVPTMDSTRSLFIVNQLHKQKKAVLMVGGAGTAKTSTALMFFEGLDPHKMLQKRVNFSSATTPFMAQQAIEVELDKRGGRNFGPPNGRAMTIFMDDMSMPEVNKWGDQPTLELVRLVVEQGGFCFLDKDKRGDFKVCEDLQYIAAMQHPGGGKNDIPNRLKRNFFIFNLVLPSIVSINDIYGQMLSGRFPSSNFDGGAQTVLGKLTDATIQLWKLCKDKLLPTPAKFHYIFNMRELSRVFQGVLSCDMETLKNGGTVFTKGLQGNKLTMKSGAIIASLWNHECFRVFCDKLTNNKDKKWFSDTIDNLATEVFGEDLCAEMGAGFNMVNFLREDIYDEDGVLIEEAPKVYEPGGDLTMLRPRVLEFLDKYNEEFPSKPMNLVLFDDALAHLLRLNRLIEMPRGSALLVGVGGSGKQSLTRLAAYISKATIFQITLTKTYNTASLMEDLRVLYTSAGHQRKQTVFLFTESEIKSETFLEYINSVLMTGEVPGLFAKDEMMAMTADLRPHFLKDRPGMEESQDNMKQYFTDLVRDNLHLVLCMSPLNPLFPVRARKFPGLISGPTVDWFLPWPADALEAVSRGLISDFPVECTPETKEGLMQHMGSVHKMVTDVCDEYFRQFRRQVYQTPKSYLSFIASYKEMYTNKLAEVKDKESRVKLGLEKLIQGAKDVEDMKVVLREEDKKLAKATEDTNAMLGNLEINAAEAKKEGDQVATIKAQCEEDAARIAKEKEACEADLAKAQPFVDEAETAIDSIKPADINEVKKLANPADIIKLTFDGVLILFMHPMGPVTAATLNVAKQELPFINPSFKPYAQQVMGDASFLNNVREFGKSGKDKINEETIEFLTPYVDLENFTPKVAKSASNACEGLCTWVRAMKFYHEASKIVKPKLEALAVAEAQMEAANKALAAAEKRLNACNARLAELQEQFDKQMAEKKRIEDGAAALAKKMNQASQLINGLSGERTRWTEDAKNFHDVKMRLVGDCAIGCAFVSYCGPFNQEFRAYLCDDKFTNDCESKGVPVTKKLDVINFLVDIGTIGDWNMEGLPTDPLSIQNGILVTRSSRYPMLIDPQGQALGWIQKREKERMPAYGTVLLNDPKLKDKLEFCMGNDAALVITGVENEVDPMLDPVLEKEIIVKGRRKMITVSDKQMDFTDGFMLYFITRLPNPLFSPELQAKTTVVDFTVTQKGLEEQLLGRVISREQKALEEQLSEVLEEVNSATKLLMELDASLLQRLTSGSGNLLEDEELIGVLANTKAKAAEVNQKLIAADETRTNINEKREQFRPVATRGAVLYFAIVEMSLVNPMYQTSLGQFLGLFMASMERAEKASLASKRVANIIETMTNITYHYVNRGLYESDKLTFILLVTLKILVTAGLLKSSDIALLLRGGAALDINSEKRKPFNWLANDSWLNVLELSRSQKFFANLPSEMAANEAIWRRWYEDNEPEAMAIPDYENRIAEQSDIGAFLKLLLIRMLRMDRSILCTKEFVRNTPQMGPSYVEPVTYTIESIFDEMQADTPVIFLLSRGADPTESIETLARKRKLPPPAVISLGEGQDVVAVRAMTAAAAEGTWVLLQNCELMLELMDSMEQMMEKFKGTGLDPNFRLFITALPHPQFPLGLLQMSTKVTNEPPAGLRAGILRSYTVLVDQERLERVETTQWRQLLFALCFLHSIVQERRKFGSLGWCIPYEYNTGDITACILFLEKHLYNGPISWQTFQYMVAEVQYGGKITDNLDKRLFMTYALKWLTAQTCAPEFSYTPPNPLFRIPNDFNYTVPNGPEIKEYRDFVSTFPEIDSPEVFGLHPNADLTFRNNEATSMLNTLGETQPKGGGGAGGVSREDVVSTKASELLERLPEDFVEEDYKAKIQKLGGLGKPLNIFLFQEIQRLQRVIGKVRFILTQLQLAIKGEVVMTEELQETLDSMFDAKVPHLWTFTVAGDEFSWILPTLGLWFTSLLSRNDQNRSWLTGGQPNSFWMTGFFNPNGFLTAMKQEVVRRHKAEKWSLDDVVDRTEATTYDRPEQVRSPPAEGVYIHGLSLEGGAWNKADSMLVESEPKKLFVPMTVVWVTANSKADQVKVRREMFGSQGPYECPVYKYPKRTDRFFIFYVTLKCTPEKNPMHWTLRAVCLLCNTD